MKPIWLESYPEEVAHKISLDEQETVDGLLDKACERFSHKMALSCLNVDLTYSQFYRLARQFSSYLTHEAGVKKGDRVAIVLPNIMQFAIAFYGSLKAGAAVTVINPRYTEREMRHQVDDASPSVVVVLDQVNEAFGHLFEGEGILATVVTSVADQLPIWRDPSRFKSLWSRKRKGSISFTKALKAGRQNPPVLVHHTGSDVALIQYTGGTTGLPKGAILRHQHLVANIRQIKEWSVCAGLGSDEKVLTVLPLYHIFALTVNFLAFLNLGCQMVLQPKPDIGETVRAFNDYPISVLTGVNALYANLVSCDAFYLVPHQLKICLAGGDALDPDTNRAFQTATGVRIYEGYGLTEASPVTHCCPIYGPDIDGTCGLPLPSTEIKLVDTMGKEVSKGEVGEVWVKGPQVFAGYWRNDEETDRVLTSDGWLKTGDLASCNEAGFFFVSGRKRDMILVSGFNVYPAEVESVLRVFPGVDDVAVIGAPDDDGKGDKVKAYIVAESKAVSVQALRNHCQENLAGYKHPETFHFCNKIPRNELGKVLRRKLASHSRLTR